jgi:hypothetical protein
MRKNRAPPQGLIVDPIRDDIVELHSPFFELFNYTPVQWEEIKKTLTTRATPGAMAPGAMEKACYDLRNSACLYVLKIQNHGLQTKNVVQLWRKVADLTTALESKLWELPEEKAYSYYEVLSDLYFMAVSRLADKLEQPKVLKPKARYQFEVLDVWTSLGGKLGIAHGDRDHGDRVTGPLSRYFAATAGPVCGGSLHTLKDIRENYKNAVRDGTWRQWEWRGWRWTRRREAQG